MNAVTLDKKIAIVSSSLPPDISGQSIMIYKLISDFPKEKYCLIRAYGRGSTYKRKFTKDTGDIYEITLDFLFGLRILKRRFLRSIFGIVMQLYCILAIPLGSLVRGIQIWRILQAEKCNLIIGCTADPLNLPASMIAARFARIPFVAYIFDDYAYQLRGYLRKFSKWLANVVVRKADRVFVTNEYIKEDYKKRYGIEAEIVRNPVALPNLALLDKIIKGGKEENVVRVVYTGQIYLAQLDAVKNFLDVIDEIDSPDIELHLYSTSTKLSFSSRGLSTKKVVFHEPVPHSEINKILRQSDILFLPLAFESPYPELIRTASPGKTGEYLAIGRPILAHVPEDNFIYAYFNHYKCGAVVGRSSKEEFKKVLLRLIDDKKWQEELIENALRCAQNDFELETVRKKFVSLMDAICKKD